MCLSRGMQLPRGKFFKGKAPGRTTVRRWDMLDHRSSGCDFDVINIPLPAAAPSAHSPWDTPTTPFDVKFVGQSQI